MIQREKIFEKIIKTGSCGDVSCHYECPFFKKNVCTAWNNPVVKAIKDIRKENEQLKLENKQVKAQIEKMKNCKNCEHYETVEDYGFCRAKCVKNKNGQWILTNWKLYTD